MHIFCFCRKVKLKRDEKELRRAPGAVWKRWMQRCDRASLHTMLQFLESTLKQSRLEINNYENSLNLPLSSHIDHPVPLTLLHITNTETESRFVRCDWKKYNTAQLLKFGRAAYKLRMCVKDWEAPRIPPLPSPCPSLPGHIRQASWPAT